MRIKNTIPLGPLRLVDYVADDASLLLINANPRIDIITLEYENMGMVNRYNVGTEPHLYSDIALDNSCIYLPTKIGHILAVDKFSGQVLDAINLGSAHISSDLIQHNDSLYCIAGIPINTGHNILFDKYSLIICNINTGKKEIQSRYFEGNPSFISLGNEAIWVIGNTSLLKFSLLGEFLGEINTGITPSCSPLITQNHVVCISKDGHLKVYDCSSLIEYASFQAKPCLSSPLNLDCGLVWMNNNGICIVDIHTKVFRTIETNRTMSNSAVTIDSSTVVGCDSSGFLIVFDTEGNSIDVLKLADNELFKPVKVENFLFVSSGTSLHQIEVKNAL